MTATACTTRTRRRTWTATAKSRTCSSRIPPATSSCLPTAGDSSASPTHARRAGGSAGFGDEGFDNDGDGRINEDDLGGPDPNRNFAYGWSLDAGWPYPMSEVETRNVFEFQRAHGNIFAAFHFHNTGRLIMFSAPLDTRATTMTVEQRREQETRVAGQLAEMRKTDRWAQLFSRVAAPEYQQDMDAQMAIVTQGARILKDYTPTFSGLSGQAQAASYFMLGAYGYLIELWGRPPLADADLNGDGAVSDSEVDAWFERDLTGEGWVMPHAVKHPDPGEVWIGGNGRKHTGRTPPARYMEEEARRVTLFVLHSASQFPRVEIDTVTVRPATGYFSLGRRGREERPGVPDLVGPRGAAGDSSEGQAVPSSGFAEHQRSSNLPEGAIRTRSGATRATRPPRSAPGRPSSV